MHILEFERKHFRFASSERIVFSYDQKQAFNVCITFVVFLDFTFFACLRHFFVKHCSDIILLAQKCLVLLSGHVQIGNANEITSDFLAALNRCYDSATEQNRQWLCQHSICYDRMEYGQCAEMLKRDSNALKAASQLQSLQVIDSMLKYTNDEKSHPFQLFNVLKTVIKMRTVEYLVWEKSRIVSSDYMDWQFFPSPISVLQCWNPENRIWQFWECVGMAPA